MSHKLERGIKEIVLSVRNCLSLKMEGIDLYQDPDITLDKDMMDMIIEHELTDLNLLEEEESWTGMIDCEPIQDLHILCDI